LSLPPEFTTGRKFRISPSKMGIFFKCIKLWHLVQDEENDFSHVGAFEALTHTEKEEMHNLAMYHI
jgi:hypothetical protein